MAMPAFRPLSPELSGRIATRLPKEELYRVRDESIQLGPPSYEQLWCTRQPEGLFCYRVRDGGFHGWWTNDEYMDWLCNETWRRWQSPEALAATGCYDYVTGRQRIPAEYRNGRDDFPEFPRGRLENLSEINTQNQVPARTIPSPSNGIGYSDERDQKDYLMTPEEAKTMWIIILAIALAGALAWIGYDSIYRRAISAKKKS